MKKHTMYGLRTCNADLTSHNGFKWKAKGRVTAPDWNERAECGGGLHFLPMGNGDGSLLNWDTDAKWLVIRPIGKVVDIGGKSKCECADVVYCGDRKGATDWLVAHGADSVKCVGVFATAGDGGTATAGNGGTATAGNGGTATAGNGGTATAGNGGTATAGDGGTAMAGHRGTATAGYYGTATAGDGGTATAGYYGTATAGDGGTATAGNGGTATAGDGGTAMAGHRGTATAGDGGTATAGNGGTATAGNGGTATAGDGGGIIFKHWTGDRYIVKAFNVGIDGIKPNVKYRLDDKGNIVEAA
jgi:hypothetical protein